MRINNLIIIESLKVPVSMGIVHHPKNRQCFTYFFVSEKRFISHLTPKYFLKFGTKTAMKLLIFTN